MARPKGKRQTRTDGTVIVAGKAGNGEGSIYFDESKGRYRATYVDPEGKRRTVLGKTKAEAAARRDAKLEDLQAATPSGKLGPDPTIGEMATWWMNNVAALQVRPATLHGYGKNVARIREHIGPTRLRQLDTETARAFVADLHKAGLAQATIRNTRSTLRQIAATAVDLDYLPANPVVGVPVPKVTVAKAANKAVLSPEEVHQLVSVLDDHPLDPAVALLFLHGWRASETLGLAWQDLDLDAGIATVRRACTYLPHVGAVLDATKTTATAGRHHLAPTVLALLEKRRTVQAEARKDAGEAWEPVEYEGELIDLVHTTAFGRPVLRQNLYTHLRKRADDAGLDPTRLGTHTGRRSVITNLFVNGVELGDVSRHVGHTNPSTTAGYVQHLGTRPADTARKAAELLDPRSADTD